MSSDISAGRGHPAATSRAGGPNASAAAQDRMAEQAYLTMMLDGQLCGVRVLSVRDVLANQTIARIPLAPPEVAGNLNLRGRIVTAIDLRRVLRLSQREAGAPQMSIVTEQGTELYALQVDQVREVLTLKDSAMEPNPPTLPALWAEHSQGVYRLEKQLLVILHVERLLHFDIPAAA